MACPYGDYFTASGCRDAGATFEWQKRRHAKGRHFCAPRESHGGCLPVQVQADSEEFILK
jgi:hypothetical protein